jgi:hypothetical protein
MDRITTSETGHEVQYKDNHYLLIVGPVEMADDNNPYPHRHAMLHSVGHSVTKGRAKEVVACFLGIEEFQPSYFKPTDNPSAYLKYMFKNDEAAGPKRKRTSNDILEDAVLASKRQKGCVDKTFIKELLSTPGNQGAAWVSKNSKLINDYISIKPLCDSRRILHFDVNEEETLENTYDVITNYRNNLKAQLKKNSFKTTCKDFADWTCHDVRRYITLMTLLPNFVSRANKVDNLPGLYFWGRSDCGKSFMFNESPAYRKVANDAKGVGRFRQEGDQAGFLLDDWTNADFMDPTNSSTLRQIALGSTARIKTFGDTEEIRGFVVATSNDIPFHLGHDIPDGQNADSIEKHRAALNRRFITLEFTEDIDVDSKTVSWLHQSALIVQKDVINVCFDKLPEGNIRNSLKMYVDHVNEQYEFNPELVEMYEKMTAPAQADDE